MNIKYTAGVDINGNNRFVIVNHTSCEYECNNPFLEYDVEIHISRTDLKNLLSALKHWNYKED